MSLRLVSNCLIASLALSIATTLASVVALQEHQQLVQTYEQLPHNRFVAKVVQLSSYALTAVLIVVWTHRLVALARLRFGSQHLPTPRAAAVSYLIPVANLLWPYLVLRRVATTSHATNRVETTRDAIRVWWLFWLAANFSAWVVAYLTHRAESDRALKQLLGWALLPDALFVVCSATAIFVVWRLTATVAFGPNSKHSARNTTLD